MEKVDSNHINYSVEEDSNLSWNVESSEECNQNHLKAYQNDRVLQTTDNHP